MQRVKLGRVYEFARILRGQYALELESAFPDALWVRDGAEGFVFEVTEQDVKNSTPQSFTNCPLSIGTRGYIGSRCAFTTPTRVYIENPDNSQEVWRFRLQNHAKTEAKMVDRGAGFQPGLYEVLPIPPDDWRHRLGSKDKAAERAEAAKKALQVTQQSLSQEAQQQHAEAAKERVKRSYRTVGIRVWTPGPKPVFPIKND